ncbi:hypothetical protein SK128_009108, partial [Halocaridina rubra]
LFLLITSATTIRAEADAFHNGFIPPHLSGFPGGGRSLNSGPARADNSHCALLIPGPGKSSSRDHAFGVFNGIQNQFQDGFTCITFRSVDDAFKAARDKYGLPRPKNNPDAKEQSNLAVVLLGTTRNIAQEYNLPKDVLINGLPLIDTFKTIIGTVCPDFITPSNCKVEKYRSYNGRCNNLDNPTWGSKNNVFKRRLPPDYADGIDAPRAGRGGYPLPSARVVSAHLHRDEGHHDHAITIMTVAWGQAIDHDFTLTAETKNDLKKEPKCCEGEHNPACLPIPVPDKDPFFSLFKRNCINVVRSLPGVRYGCKLGPRAQTNSVTAYIDANWVYGSDEETAKRIRLGRGGLMKSLPVFREYGMKDLLPLKLEEPEDGCIRPNRDVYCFDAGDGRVNEQLVLAVVHTMMMREHNRIATELYKINPHWDDETLYQETRHIISAQIQHISYNEFLPMVLGKDVMTKYGLILEKHGYFDGYDPKIDVSMSANFVTSAFRFGHSLLPSTVERWSPGNKYIASQRLSEMLRQPYDLYKGGWCDQYIMGLTNQVAQAMDDAVTQEVTNHLFQEPDKKWGMDLAAINMQRGREHGVPSYNQFREFCGLPKAYKFDDLLGSMSNKTVRRYGDIYRHPDDIDLWSGGVSERPLPGSMVGATFSCLIGLTFKELRYGDRFWYENRGYPSSFTPEQLEEIRKIKLSRIICDNSDDIKVMQVYAMVLPDHEINPRVPCNSGILPRMDLTKWRDPHGPHPRPPAQPLPLVEINPLILPPGTKQHFEFPRGNLSVMKATLSRLPTITNNPKSVSQASHPPSPLPPPPPTPPHTPPHIPALSPPSPPQPTPPHVPALSPPSTSHFHVHSPQPIPFTQPKPHPPTPALPTGGIKTPPTFGPVKPSSEIHILEGHPPSPPVPPKPYPSFNNAPKPLAPSYGAPDPIPNVIHNEHSHVSLEDPVPEPIGHAPSPSYGAPKPLPEPHHHIEPSSRPDVHVNFDAPYEYCQGHFTPLPPNYGRPAKHGHRARKNPFERFLGMIGING